MMDRIVKIKEAMPFGSGGAHIILDINSVGKKFLVLPESSKYILRDILKQYADKLKEITNPNITEILTKKEVESIHKTYEKLIKEHKDHKGYAVNLFKKNIEHTSNRLDQLKVNDLGLILDEIGDHLPDKLKEKILNEFYKAQTSL